MLLLLACRMRRRSVGVNSPGGACSCPSAHVSRLSAAGCSCPTAGVTARTCSEVAPARGRGQVHGDSKEAAQGREQST